MVDSINKKLSEIFNLLPSEEVYTEAVRDIMKDLIKEFIKKEINRNPSLKKALVEAMKEFMEAKLKEYDSMAKMAKVTASIGLAITPKSLKDEAVKDFVEMFQGEIEEIIRKTF